VVRLATADDVEEVARLLIAFRDHLGRDEPSAERFREVSRMLIADPNTEFLLAGEPAAGICQLRYRPCVWLDADDCTLEDLFVAGHARGAGLGRALVDAAIQRARARGCARIVLDANEANTAAIALYESAGFSSGSGPRDLFLRRRV
jgi:ribosomal protein S18 acetylase RimI-like enzyme